MASKSPEELEQFAKEWNDNVEKASKLERWRPHLGPSLDDYRDIPGDADAKLVLSEIQTFLETKAAEHGKRLSDFRADVDKEVKKFGEKAKGFDETGFYSQVQAVLDLKAIKEADEKLKEYKHEVKAIIKDFEKGRQEAIKDPKKNNFQNTVDNTRNRINAFKNTLRENGDYSYLMASFAKLESIKMWSERKSSNPNDKTDPDAIILPLKELIGDFDKLPLMPKGLIRFYNKAPNAPFGLGESLYSPFREYRKYASQIIEIDQQITAISDSIRFKKTHLSDLEKDLLTADEKTESGIRRTIASQRQEINDAVNSRVLTLAGREEAETKKIDILTVVKRILEKQSRKLMKKYGGKVNSMIANRQIYIQQLGKIDPLKDYKKRMKLQARIERIDQSLEDLRNEIVDYKLLRPVFLFERIVGVTSFPMLDRPNAATSLATEKLGMKP